MKKCLILIIVGVFFLSSCRLKDQYWPIHSGTVQPYKLDIIQVDDEGGYWNKDDAKSSLEHIKELTKSKNVVVLLFAHGWHHNARSSEPEDSNLVSFKDTLSFLRKELDLKKYKDARFALTGDESVEIIGVYLGWRGKALKNDLVDYLTFWPRKRAAKRVGEGGAFEYISDLNEIYKGNYDSGRDNFMGLVSVGHSFGGQVMFKSVADTLENSFKENQVNGESNNNRIQGFGDLVVLINPALESNQFQRLSELQNEIKPYHYIQTPQLLVVSGSGDGPNKFWFPVGRILGNPTRIFNIKSLQSLGMYKPHVSHSLELVENETNSFSGQDGFLSLEFLKFDFTERVVFGGAKLQRDNGFNIGYSPLVVARTTEELLIEGHNGIFTDKFRVFLMDYVAHIEALKLLSRPNSERAKAAVKAIKAMQM